MTVRLLVVLSLLAAFAPTNSEQAGLQESNTELVENTPSLLMGSTKCSQGVCPHVAASCCPSGNYCCPLGYDCVEPSQMQSSCGCSNCPCCKKGVPKFTPPKLASERCGESPCDKLLRKERERAAVREAGQQWVQAHPFQPQIVNSVRKPVDVIPFDPVNASPEQLQQVQMIRQRQYFYKNLRDVVMAPPQQPTTTTTQSTTTPASTTTTPATAATTTTPAAAATTTTPAAAATTTTPAAAATTTTPAAAATTTTPAAASTTTTPAAASTTTTPAAAATTTTPVAASTTTTPAAAATTTTPAAAATTAAASAPRFLSPSSFPNGKQNQWAADLPPYYSDTADGSFIATDEKTDQLPPFVPDNNAASGTSGSSNEAAGLPPFTNKEGVTTTTAAAATTAAADTNSNTNAKSGEISETAAKPLPVIEFRPRIIIENHRSAGGNSPAVHVAVTPGGGSKHHVHMTKSGTKRKEFSNGKGRVKVHYMSKFDDKDSDSSLFQAEIDSSALLEEADRIMLVNDDDTAEDSAAASKGDHFGEDDEEEEDHGLDDVIDTFLLEVESSV